ncbi:MAG: YccF domain-containing protein [Phenylobacterium sp.]|jgi:uncharacterized membrane protein YccF (DUF307 family)|uniref:YccF domain-containing protein n=1 Tax=Phenylobacterium sp. TaxID=1871053 RepID=UPI0025E0A920|nr:YccF domain-containing protein [Phenylobacterium sp.]MCA3709538.1 YccF domain-containing protein [Phenylobacterium sp.]MCA3715441.1 YccF domain-containing protein [Phenylobacterium sp.]MCA3722593.1 YccF domain-containing protein [Phenylobacterium sp.]MCA3725568.1 YccF domain-containing protein [Phenylobacterium sp.]MCA3728326.1 YccF domain-containing protein [Phenylobacterium sp.]
MNLVLNILWFVLGGFIAGTLWMVAGLLLLVTVVGAPWAFAAFRIGRFSYAPFGRQAIPRMRDDLGTGCLGLGLNVIWLVLGGWYLAIQHILIGAGLCLTVIGIPFGLQHLKLAIISLAPVGTEIVRT